MGKHFFDYEDDDFACSISDNIAIDSDGDLLIRMGDDMAMGYGFWRVAHYIRLVQR